MLTRVCLTAALLCIASALPQIQNVDRPGRIPGEYLVVLRPTPQAQRASYVQETIAKIGSISASINLIKKFDALESPILHFQAEEVAIRQAFKIPEVVSIEANVFEYVLDQCSTQNTGSTYWGLSRTSSVGAPNYSNAQYSYRTSGGSGVRVYVLDTGIRTTHEDFSGGRAVFGANTIGGNDADGHGHGTHCAGTVLGINSGVAKAATAVAVKVVNDFGSGAVSNAVDGVNWVIGDINNRGRGVISMSLGYGISSAIDAAVESAISDNIPVVASAGNSNGNACNQSPARATGVITVAATDNTDTLSSFSNFGTCVDIMAPGTTVRSAGRASDSAYVNMSGTSMSCPHVAGGVAAYLQQNPNASPAQVMAGLSSASSKNQINMRGTSGTPNELLYESC